MGVGDGQFAEAHVAHPFSQVGGARQFAEGLLEGNLPRVVGQLRAQPGVRAGILDAAGDDDRVNPARHVHVADQGYEWVPRARNDGHVGCPLEPVEIEALADALIEGLTLMRADTVGVRNDTVRRLLGREPRTFTDWCARNAHAFPAPATA
jgi:hypothetical protein